MSDVCHGLRDIKGRGAAVYMFGDCGAAADCEAGDARLRESMFELGDMIGLQGSAVAGPAA